MKELLLKSLVIHGTCMAVLVLLAATLGSTHQIISALLGSSLVGLNLFILAWGWHRIFFKKRVALAASVIVFKYAILVGIIYYVVTGQKADLIWFTGGLVSVAPSIIGLALTVNESRL